MLRDKLKQLLLKHLIERPSQDEIIRELAQHRIPIKLYNSIILFTLKKIGKPIQSKKPRYLSLKNVNDEEIEKGNESKISDDSVSFGSLFISKDIYASKENVFSEEEIKNKINHFKNNFKIEEVEEGLVDELIKGCKEYMVKRIKKEKGEDE
ncbi:hypothetical protein TUBRATIS_009480 [Tubulinosema ratisbonensis]|uniref:Uncharacterized protein n=1 Tax=Tubulinosema ratisbonensis TaxID=291195 RepID=A0A437AMY6_9MICR|nr:hypothetical protein TUBRATIS_009480 [Tubulinosema ratisbonensis]